MEASPHSCKGRIKNPSQWIRLLREEKGAIPLSANCFAVQKKEAQKQCFEEWNALMGDIYCALHLKEAKNKESKAVLGVIIQAIFPIENFNDTQ